jgi:arylformamidase
MACWPGDPPFSLEEVTSLERDGVRTSKVSMATHTGTHLDAPAHLIRGGRTVDELDLEVLVGPCWIVKVTAAAGCIQRDMLEDLRVREGLPLSTALGLETPRRLLLRTRSAQATACHPTPHAGQGHLDGDAARWLVEHQVSLVGIDTLSIDAFDSPDLPAHHTLLGAEVVILEGLDLQGLPSGLYDLVALPLRIHAGDGAPCRVLLRPRALPSGQA